MAEIVSLDREKYDYFPLEYKYETNSHYVVKSVSSKEKMSLELVRENYESPRRFENTDTLFQPYWTCPEAYAIRDDDGNLCGFVEFDFEDWNSRMRMTQLLVPTEHRKKGYGKKLMDFAKQIAKERDYRIIVLETQNTNTPAIDFYLSQGFEFCGGNIYFYSNEDINDDEVMLEMAYLM